MTAIANTVGPQFQGLGRWPKRPWTVVLGAPLDGRALDHGSAPAVADLVAEACAATQPCFALEPVA